MEKPLEIFIQHDGAISLDALTDAITVIRSVSHRVSYDFLGSGLVPEDVIANAPDFLRAHLQDAIWLEDVSNGSFSFKGTLQILVLAPTLWFGGKFAGDVLDESERYRELVTITAEHVDNIVDYFVEVVNSIEGSPDSATIRAELVGDRLRIYVVPNERQTNIHRLK